MTEEHEDVVPVEGGLDPDFHRVAAAAVAGAAIGWWPAFTFGVYGVIFFAQHMALWAAASSAFLAAVLSPAVHVLRRPAIWALLLPSLWVLLDWLVPVGGTSAIHQVLFWFGAVLTLLGMPALAALLVRLLIPGSGVLHGKQALRAGVIVVAVMLASYLVGTQHPRLLTCQDFSISGNFAPESCSPGSGSTVR